MKFIIDSKSFDFNTVSAKEVHFKKGEYLFEEGVNDAHIYFILSGEVKILKGKWVLWCAVREELIGISSFFAEGTAYNFSARASSDSVVMKVSSNDFRVMLVSNPEFSRTIMEMMCERINLTQVRSKNLLRYSSKYRLIAEVIKYVNKTGVKKLDITIEELSELIGVSRRLVRKIINELEDKKLLKRKNNELIIHDLKGLEIVASLE